MIADHLLGPASRNTSDGLLSSVGSHIKPRSRSSFFRLDGVNPQVPVSQFMLKYVRHVHLL